MGASPQRAEGDDSRGPQDATRGHAGSLAEEARGGITHGNRAQGDGAHGNRAQGGGALDWDALAEQCGSLAEALSAEGTVYGVLKQVVDASVAMMPGAELVSVTLRDDNDTFRTPVETDARATRLDELQYRYQEGPCVLATCTPGPGLAASGDLAAGHEWPRWGPAAAREGVRSVLSLGLFVSGESSRFGALNFYSTRHHGLHEVDRTLALLLASHASIALAATRAVGAAELQAAHLQEALRSRDVIGQAKGILMNRQGISSEEAFDVLRRTSQDLNVKLTHIAETVVNRQGDI